MLATRQSKEYLASMFHLSPSTEVRSELNSDLNILCQQFDKASVALRAFIVSCLNGLENKAKAQDNLRVLEFLEHFETLLYLVDNVMERFVKRNISRRKTCRPPLLLQKMILPMARRQHIRG